MKSLLVLPAVLALVLAARRLRQRLRRRAAARGGETTTLTVYAAASLTATFEEIGKEFEAEHDGVKVEFNFGGSSDLVAQIQEGAPADVFASADTENMDKLVDDDLDRRRPAGLRDQHPRDRHAAGQPRRGRRASRTWRRRASSWSSARPRCRAAPRPRRWPTTSA